MQTAKDVMSKNVITIQASATVAEAIDKMQQQKLRNLVVISDDADDEYGVVTEADIVYQVAAQGTNPETITVSQIMTSPCIEVDPEMSVQEVAALFANHHIHRAPVVKGEILGMITVFDIVRETMWWQ